MTKVYIVSEGPTEKLFIDELLEPVLRPHKVWPIACLIGESGAKGGNISRARAEKTVLNLLKQHQDSYCTTLFDYYGLRGDFPGLPAPPGKTTEEKATLVEEAFCSIVAEQLPDRLRPDRFLPYIQMHEFEGLLFSNPSGLAKGIYRRDLERHLEDIRRRFGTPEDINDRRETSPSHRIRSLYPGYQKPLYGALAALEIGIAAIRAECGRFNAWVERLCRLGNPA